MILYRAVTNAFASSRVSFQRFPHSRFSVGFVGEILGNRSTNCPARAINSMTSKTRMPKMFCTRSPRFRLVPCSRNAAVKAATPAMRVLVAVMGRASACMVSAEVRLGKGMIQIEIATRKTDPTFSKRDSTIRGPALHCDNKQNKG